MFPMSSRKKQSPSQEHWIWPVFTSFQPCNVVSAAAPGSQKQSVETWKCTKIMAFLWMTVNGGKKPGSLFQTGHLASRHPSVARPRKHSISSTRPSHPYCWLGQFGGSARKPPPWPHNTCSKQRLGTLANLIVLELGDAKPPPGLRASCFLAASGSLGLPRLFDFGHVALCCRLADTPHELI